MDDKEFKQQLALTLAGNPEFIKQAASNYNGKLIWFPVTEQINATLNKLDIANE